LTSYKLLEGYNPIDLRKSGVIDLPKIEGSKLQPIVSVLQKDSSESARKDDLAVKGSEYGDNNTRTERGGSVVEVPEVKFSSENENEFDFMKAQLSRFKESFQRSVYVGPN